MKFNFDLGVEFTEKDEGQVVRRVFGQQECSNTGVEGRTKGAERMGGGRTADSLIVAAMV